MPLDFFYVSLLTLSSPSTPSSTWFGNHFCPLIIATSHLCIPLGFHFQALEPTSPRRMYAFKPASVRSLWSAVQSLMKILERTDPVYAPWPWLDQYRGLITTDSAKTVRCKKNRVEEVYNVLIIKHRQGMLRSNY